MNNMKKSSLYNGKLKIWTQIQNYIQLVFNNYAKER